MFRKSPLDCLKGCTLWFKLSDQSATQTTLPNTVDCENRGNRLPPWENYSVLHDTVEDARATTRDDNGITAREAWLHALMENIQHLL